MSTLITDPVAGEPSVAARQDGNLASSIGRNTIFGIISSMVQIVTRFITVPIVIAHLGLGGYGIWSIIMTTAAYMRFGSVGVKSAFQKYVAEATGNGNYESTSKLLSTGCAAMLVLSLAGLVPIAIFSTQIARFSGVPNEFLHSSGLAISMLALIMVLSNAGAAYEATVMGAHRIDLTRKFATVSCAGEAVGIVWVLHLGYGLFAMAAVMAISEVFFVACCYFASRRVAPRIEVGFGHISKTVVRELIRFAGSYQVVSILQLIYAAIPSIAILRVYGADRAGILALANRLVSPVYMCQYAFIVPVLSGSAMVFASGSTETMRKLLAKSYKVTLAMTLIPLALISAFGTYVIFAWTGQADPHFRVTLFLISLATMFQAFSVLGLVLYRASGRALMDNIREVLRICTILPVVLFARQLGFYGVLGGIAAAELVGMIVMFCALAKTYHVFDLHTIFRDVLRMSAATAVILGVCYFATRISFASTSGARTVAAVKVAEISLAILLSVYPALSLTGSLSSAELRSVRDALRKRTVHK
jgi:O-antigen/teichoic acid export membrane protein